MATSEELSYVKFMRFTEFVRKMLGFHPRKKRVLLVFALIFIVALVLFGLFLLFILFPLLTVGIFNGVRRSYYMIMTSITPAFWIFFLIWPAIFIALAIGIGYAIIAFFLLLPGGFAIMNPLILTGPVLVNTIAALFSSTAWMFIFDNFRIFPRTLALAVNVVSIVSLAFATGLLAVTYAQYRGTLVASGRLLESLIIGLFWLNGLGMFLTFMIYNATLDLAYVLPVGSPELASTIAIGSLAVLAGIYFLADITVLERYTRYLISPYLTLMAVMSAILNEGFDIRSASSLIVCVLLGALLMMTIARMALMIYVTIGINNDKRKKKQILVDSCDMDQCLLQY